MWSKRDLEARLKLIPTPPLGRVVSDGSSKSRLAYLLPFLPQSATVPHLPSYLSGPATAGRYGRPGTRSWELGGGKVPYILSYFSYILQRPPRSHPNPGWDLALTRGRWLVVPTTLWIGSAIPRARGPAGASRLALSVL